MPCSVVEAARYRRRLSTSVMVPALKPYVVCDLGWYLDSMDHGYGYRFDIR